MKESAFNQNPDRGNLKEKTYSKTNYQPVVLPDEFLIIYKQLTSTRTSSLETAENTSTIEGYSKYKKLAKQLILKYFREILRGTQFQLVFPQITLEVGNSTTIIQPIDAIHLLQSLYEYNIIPSDPDSNLHALSVFMKEIRGQNIQSLNNVESIKNNEEQGFYVPSIPRYFTRKEILLVLNTAYGVLTNPYTFNFTRLQKEIETVLPYNPKTNNPPGETGKKEVEAFKKNLILNEPQILGEQTPITPENEPPSNHPEIKELYANQNSQPKNRFPLSIGGFLANRFKPLQNGFKRR